MGRGQPHLEYIFEYPGRKDIDILKQVQRRATNMIRGWETMMYGERLKEMDLCNLKQICLRVFNSLELSSST